MSDLPTARYVGIRAWVVRSRQTYDITRISLLADEIESSGIECCSSQTKFRDATMRFALDSASDNC